MLESMLRKGEAYTGVEEPHGWTIVSFQGKYADVPEKDIYDAEDLYVLSARILWQ